ncbi:branched-chain amino acid ABC transporter permease [Bordetella pertussis]|nr:branched-chain amino acid ABC transporter permease [Bordetella pertussis]
MTAIVQLAVINLDDLTGGAAGMPMPPLEIAGHVLDNGASLYLVIVPVFALSYALVRNLMRSRIGRAFGAVRQGEIAAAAMGVNVLHYKASAFAASGFLGALGGGLLGALSSYLDPSQYGITQTVYYLAIAVVGGMASPLGALIGSAIFVFIPKCCRACSRTWPGVRAPAAGLHHAAPGRAGQFHRAPAPRAGRAFHRARGGEQMTHPILEVARVTMRFAASWPSTTSACRCARATSTRSSVPTARARARCSTSSPASTVRPRRGAPAGRQLDRLPPHRICRLGVCRNLPEHRAVRRDVGRWRTCRWVSTWRRRTAWPARCCTARATARGERALRAQAMELLRLVGLAQDGDTPAAALPFGKQRRLEVARALATGPACCCWTNRRRDCAPPRSKGSTTSLLRVRRERGLSILVIDHVMALVMKISDRITVLNFGPEDRRGRPEEVRRSPAVIKAYLGERGRDAVLCIT